MGTTNVVGTPVSITSPAPSVLTDALYVAYGGMTGTSTAAQRQAAYMIAEYQMQSHIGTYLVPTTVTGTYMWPHLDHDFVLPHGYVIDVKSVKALSQEEWDSCELAEYDGCAYIDSYHYGYIHVKQIENAWCNCHSTLLPPYQMRVVYEAGLPAGSAAADPSMVLALTIVAEINLNEIIDRSANEGVGDIGIQEFSNQEYSEKRYKLNKNSFGTSARAKKAANLVGHYKRYRALRL